MFKSILCIALACVIQIANASVSTQVNLLFQGYSLTRYGGPVTDVLYSLKIPMDAPNRTPDSPFNSQYAVDVDIVTGELVYSGFGFLQLRSSHPNNGTSSMVFFIAYPGETFPGQSINTQISGIEINFEDSTGRMVTSTAPEDLKSDFASYLTSFSYYERIGGWGAGLGHFHDETGNSLATAKFQSMVTSVDEPNQIMLFTAGLAALMLILRRKESVTTARMFGAQIPIHPDSVKRFA